MYKIIKASHQNVLTFLIHLHRNLGTPVYLTSLAAEEDLLTSP